MDDTNHQPGPLHSREAFLALMLTVFLGVGSAVLLIFVTGGFFFWVILISAGLGLFACLHYLLWGWLMEQSVRGERERLQREEQEPGPSSPSPGERRF